MSKKNDGLKFEEALTKLEDIVKNLESGNLPLEEALGFFEEGIRLIAHCNAKLEEVEKKIEYLTDNNEAVKEPPEGDATN